MNEMPDTMILANLDRMWETALDRLERERWEAEIERIKTMRDSRKARRSTRESYEERLKERFRRAKS